MTPAANLPTGQAGWKVGQLTREPTEFKPTATKTDLNYLYQVDYTAGIAKRSPLHWNSAEPTGYYRLELPQPAVQAPQPSAPAEPVKARQPRRWPRWMLKTAFTSAMLAGLVMLAYPLYPAVWYRVERQLAVFDSNLMAATPAMTTQWGSNQVIIPKIGVRAAILEGRTQAILDEQEGVWHQKGDLKSNFVLAGHRFKFLPPNTSTFYNLNQLQPGDVILVDWYNRRYAYTVQKNFIVNKNQIEILRDQAAPVLTLYTCSDKDEKERVVITAVPQE